MNKKVKEFWEKNKKTIVVGTVSAVAGGVFAAALTRKVHGEAIQLWNVFQQYNYISKSGNTFTVDMFEAQKNATHIDLFGYQCNGGNITLMHLLDDAREAINEGVFDPDVKITGMLVFSEK